MHAFGYGSDEIVMRALDTKRMNIAPRRHDLPEFAFAEIKDIAYDCLFLILDYAAFHAFLDY